MKSVIGYWEEFAKSSYEKLVSGEKIKIMRARDFQLCYNQMLKDFATSEKPTSQEDDLPQTRK